MKQEFADTIELLNKNGGIIYIDILVINLVTNNLIIIKGKLSGGIIGIRQTNGEYPRLNFIKNEDQIFFEINVYGSNKFIKYMMFENSPDNGNTGDNNILDHKFC